MITFPFFRNKRNHILKNFRSLSGFIENALLRPLKSDETNYVIYDLINNCDLETVERLMEYFESNAPVQDILKKRYTELKQNTVGGGLNEYLKKEIKKEPDFYIYLTDMIEKKGFRSDSDFYNYIGMSRQTFSKIRKKGANVSRNHALLMAVGLGLNYNEAVEFMRKAGYAFKKTDPREAIVMYVMRSKKYDLMEMEEILYSFGEKTLIEI